MLIVIGMAFSLYSQSQSVGRFGFNDDWKFKRLTEEEKNADLSQPAIDASGWTDVDLPHTAHIEPLVVNNQWQGIAWYRKRFFVPENYGQKKVFVEFEAAMNVAEFWVNGKRITKHLGGYLPVVLDVSGYLLPGAENVIAVRLDNTDNPVTGPKPLKILDYNMYGGLYRNAWLIVKNKVHISHPNFVDKVAGGGVFITTPKVDKKQSLVHVKTHVQNESELDQRVQLLQTVWFGEKRIANNRSKYVNIESGRDFDFETELTVTNAMLWSPKTPDLYQMETVLLVNGDTVDTEKTRFGIRSFLFENNQLYINGEKVFLRGVNRHQEYPFVGYALSDNAQYRDAKKIKDGGFDYIRLSHYPQSPAFLDACDELGLVVIDAISGWQYYADNEDFRNYCYNSAEQLVRRDRNHPCVMAWEVSLNETQMPVFFMEELHKRAHAEDPRPDAYTCGWKPDVYDIYLQARQHRIMHPPHAHTKPYSVSEYGDWEYYSSNAGLNQHQLDKQTRYETSSRQARAYGEERLLQQATNVQEAHNDNLSTPAYSDSYWVMFDYNRGYHDDLEYSGVMDIFRIPKFAYYFYQSQRNPEEQLVCKIASYWTQKSPLNLRVLSNCDEIELVLNGKSLGRKSPDKNISNNLQHPPFTFSIEKFEEGELKAIGFINGEKVAEDIVKTPENAARLKIWIDESGKTPSTNDVMFVYIAAVDGNGTIVPDYSGEINVVVEGEASLMNYGKVKAEAGIATALIKIGSSAENVVIHAKSKNIDETNFQFNVKH